MQKRNEYCVFFNRFGRCSKKDQGECPYIHDPKRIAVCTRFVAEEFYSGFGILLNVLYLFVKNVFFITCIIAE